MGKVLSGEVIRRKKGRFKEKNPKDSSLKRSPVSAKSHDTVIKDPSRSDLTTSQKAFVRWKSYLSRWKSQDNAKSHVSQVKPKMVLNISSRLSDEFYKEYGKAKKAGIK